MLDIAVPFSSCSGQEVDRIEDRLPLRELGLWHIADLYGAFDREIESSSRYSAPRQR